MKFSAHFLFFTPLLLVACEMQLGPTFNDKEERLQSPIKNKDMGFKKLKGEWLYVDRKKNAYIKQVTFLQANPSMPREKVLRYFNLVAFKDTILPMQNLIHVATFNQVDSFKYEDKNHYYLYNPNAKSPPAFSCIEK